MSGSSAESVSDGDNISDWALVDEDGAMEDDSCSTSSVEVVNEEEENEDDHLAETPQAGTSPQSLLSSSASSDRIQPCFVLRLSSCEPSVVESDDDAASGENKVDESVSFDMISSEETHQSASLEQVTDSGPCMAQASPVGVGVSPSERVPSEPQPPTVGSMTASQLVREEDINSLVAAIDQLQSDLPLIMSRSLSRQESSSSSLIPENTSDQGLEVNETSSVIGPDILSDETEEMIGQDESEAAGAGVAGNPVEATIKEETVELTEMGLDSGLAGKEELPYPADQGTLLEEAVATEGQTMFMPSPAARTDAYDFDSLAESLGSRFSFLITRPEDQTDRQMDHVGTEDIPPSTADSQTDVQGDLSSGSPPNLDLVLRPSNLPDTMPETALMETDTVVRTREPPGVLELFTDLVEEVRRKPVGYLCVLAAVLLLWTGSVFCLGYLHGRTSQKTYIMAVQNMLQDCTESRHTIEQTMYSFRQKLETEKEDFSRSYGTCRKLLDESDERNSYLWSEVTKLRYARANNDDTIPVTLEVQYPEDKAETEIDETEIEEEEEEEDEEGDEEEDSDVTVEIEESFDPAMFDDGSFVEESDEGIFLCNGESGPRTEEIETLQTGQDGDKPCSWCFNELNKLREKWMKAEAERETETARAQMWMDLYKEERENTGHSKPKTDNHKTVNLHNCWKYVTENFTGGANFFRSFGLSWVDIQKLWPEEIVNMFEYFIRSKQQGHSEPQDHPPKQDGSQTKGGKQGKTDKTADWDTDFTSSEDEHAGQTGSQSAKGEDFWADTVMEMLNKTKTSVSTVNKQIKQTWDQVKNMSEKLWKKHKPALHNIQKSFTKKIEQVSRKFQEKLEKRTKGWFSRARREEESQSTDEGVEQKHRASTSRRPHTHDTNTENQHGNERPGKGHNRGHRQNPTKHSRHGNKGHRSKARRKYIEEFREMRYIMRSLNVKEYNNLLKDEKESVFEAVERLLVDDGHQHLDDGQLGWLQCQAQWWEVTVYGSTDSEYDCGNLYHCWQIYVWFGQDMARACREGRKQQHGKAVHLDGFEEEGMEDMEDIDETDDIGNLDQESSKAKPIKPDHPDKSIDWMSERARKRDQLRHLDNWFYERAMERENLRGKPSSVPGEESLDWLSRRAKIREAEREREKDEEEKYLKNNDL